MSEAMQLTVDGREVPHDAVRRTGRKPPLSPAQRDIIAFAKLRGGTVRPIQAGVIMHRCRPEGWRNHRHRRGDIERRGEPERCCEFASSDGNDAIKRLVARGALEKISKGLYAIVGWTP